MFSNEKCLAIRSNFRRTFLFSIALFFSVLLPVCSHSRGTEASEQPTATSSREPKSSSAAQSPQHVPIAAIHPSSSTRSVHLLVILIGGMDSDPTARQIAGTATRKEGNSGLYRLRGDLSRKQVIPEYFNWNGSRAGELAASGSGDVSNITNFIEMHLTRCPHDRVAIVGNSWGGHTAWEVLTQLHERKPQAEISLAVFLDGSSTGRANLQRKSLPSNVSQSLNIFTRNSFVWGKISATATRLENVDLGDPTRGFLKQSGPAYQASLNFKAHVAAEWDEEVHALIRRRLLSLLPENKEGNGHKPSVTEPASTLPKR